MGEKKEISKEVFLSLNNEDKALICKYIALGTIKIKEK